MSGSKVLVHAAYPIWRRTTLITLARARELQDQGDEVLVSYCNAKHGTCACNYSGTAFICRICRVNFRKTAEQLGLRTVPLDERSPDEPAPAPLRVSHGKELLEGVRSSTVSAFRLLAKDERHSPAVLSVKRRYFNTAAQLLRRLISLAESERPDRMETFNGRHACAKAMLIAARTCNIPFNTLEGAPSRRPIVFEGHTPHDRREIQARMLTHEADMEGAERFFARRRRSRRGNAFAKRQSQSFTPPDATGFERKVAVYLSSQDEFESLGSSWNSNFDAEHEVLLRAAQRYSNFLFAIRFHPNQAGIKSDITSDYRELDALPNTRIYYPSDEANTYDLIDWADTVVTFNSTVATEACWMGKPVIIIGPSFYDALEVGHTPPDEAEALELLGRSDLEVGNRENAARLAHYFTYAGDDFKYIIAKDGKMVGDGIGRHRSWESYLARYTDVLWCRIVRAGIPRLGKNGR